MFPVSYERILGIIYVRQPQSGMWLCPVSSPYTHPNSCVLQLTYFTLYTLIDVDDYQRIPGTPWGVIEVFHSWDSSGSCSFRAPSPQNQNKRIVSISLPVRPISGLHGNVREWDMSSILVTYDICFST